MSLHELTAKFKDGQLFLYPNDDFERWHIELDESGPHPIWNLYEFPEGGGMSQLIDEFGTAEGAVNAAQELT